MTSETPGSGQVAPAASPPTTAALRPPGSGEASWRYVGADKKNTYDTYIDGNSITDRSGYRYAWIKTIYRVTQRDRDGEPYNSSVDLSASIAKPQCGRSFHLYCIQKMDL